MPLDPVTVLVRGRPLVISVADLERELAADGAPRSLAHLEAVIRSGAGAAAVARLRRIVRAGDPGVATLQAVFGLVRLGAADSAADLERLGAALGGSPGAIARAAAFLVADRAADLAAAAAGDALLARHSPQPYLHVTRLVDGAAALFAAWCAELRRESTLLGVTALRAFLGDVAEALFRSLQLAITPATADPARVAQEVAAGLLDAEARGYLVDVMTAELPGTTDFVAARAMAWLLGALAADDEVARSAIERARARFRDPEFQADCEAMLAGRPWPPAHP